MQSCCISCFDDAYLKNYIQNEREIGTCSFCGSQGRGGIKPVDHQELLERLKKAGLPTRV